MKKPLLLLIGLSFLVSCADPNAALLADFKHLEIESERIKKADIDLKGEIKQCRMSLDVSNNALKEMQSQAYVKSIKPKLLPIPDWKIIELDLTKKIVFDGSEYFLVIKGGAKSDKNCGLFLGADTKMYCKKAICHVQRLDGTICRGVQ